MPEHLTQTEKHIRYIFENEGTGHDWWHIWRVRKLALKIAEKEGGDQFIIEMAALLHDLEDWKMAGISHTGKTREWLQKLNLPAEKITKIIQIISEVSFKGAGVETKPSSLEARIVQDADRLDAIGAIGISRAFAYGGSKGRLIFDPEIKPEIHKDFESYKKNTGPTINHFYEKLLLIKDRLNTETAKKMAGRRHRFMVRFLREFTGEWNGEF